jgi:hypothetical protein
MKYADSVVLALVASGFLGLGQLCRYADSCGLFELLWRVVFAPLVIIAMCFAVRDLRRPAVRWQAVCTLILVVLLWVIGARVFW